jgi:hypothetical protein
LIVIRGITAGRALQENFIDLAVSGLASMYPAFRWSISLRAIMDISARAISLTDRPRPGHLGHQCSHAPGRPNLHLVSFSRRPRRVRRPGSGYVIGGSWFCADPVIFSLE